MKIMELNFKTVIRRTSGETLMSTEGESQNWVKLSGTRDRGFYTK